MSRLFQYVPAGTVIHRLDPRIKILSLLGLGLFIFQAGPVMIVPLGLVLILAARFSGLTGPDLVRSLQPLRIFFLLLFLVHLLFTGGRPFSLTYQGLYLGVLTVFQFILLIIATSIMTTTTSPSMMVSGLEKLFSPLRILRLPVHDLATMISISLNFVPLILGEIEKVKEAQAARGAQFESRSPLRRIRLFFDLFIPVSINIFRKADDLALAMEARGYGKGPRSTMKVLKLTRHDYLALMVIAAITAATIYLN